MSAHQKRAEWFNERFPVGSAIYFEGQSVCVLKRAEVLFEPWSAAKNVEVRPNGVVATFTKVGRKSIRRCDLSEPIIRNDSVCYMVASARDRLERLVDIFRNQCGDAEFAADALFDGLARGLVEFVADAMSVELDDDELFPVALDLKAYLTRSLRRTASRRVSESPSPQG